MAQNRGGASVRQWQLYQWLRRSSRALSAEELRGAVGLSCSLKTVVRDLAVLAQVFEIEKKNWNHDTKYELRGERPDVPRYAPRKRCSRCKEFKDRETEFWRDGKEPDEKSKYCISCHKLKNKAGSPERKKFYRDYYRRHKKKITERKAKRRMEERKIVGRTS